MDDEDSLVLGIDDAGRGPLIGPMVLAGCLITKDIEEEFQELGVKDSKMLTDKKREFLAEQIRKKAISFHLALSSPLEIDSRASSGMNLNKIEAIKSAEIINHLTKDINKPINIIIDCPSTNKERWKNYVWNRIIKKDNILLKCEHKADRDYVACSAASILAKSEREKEIAKIKKKIGKDFGSGYPSDPLTREFLNKYKKEHQENGIFRETWATFQDNKKQKEQKKIFDF